MKIAQLAAVLKIDTWGWMAVSSLVICCLSGVLLAIPYDISDPYGSISLMLLENPAANFFRNLHFWSAQAFLILTVIHIFDHFFKNTEEGVSRGLWLRLTLTVAVVFFAMLSGFILKGDADAIQARRIFAGLLSTIPLAGRTLSFSLLGSEADLQLVYIHHVATATIIILVFTYEHAKAFWPDLFRFLIILFILVLLSFFLRAPLHDGYDPVIKGPWYFVGLQEILHWMKDPGDVWWILLGFFILFYLVKELSKKAGLYVKRFLLASALIYLALTIVGYFFRGENWKWTSPFSAREYSTSMLSVTTFAGLPDEYTGGVSLTVKTGSRYEGCMVCHGGMQGFTASHDPQAIGCASCHAGDPFTLDKEKAHGSMITIPGNLENSARSCGTAECHPAIASRIDNSIMSTLSGMVSVNRFVFGESESLSVLSHITGIGHSPADEHLRDLCAHCHLGHPKTEYGPITQLSRGGGCNACHLNHDENSLSELVTYKDWIENEFSPSFHPSLSLEITDDHCLGCHSRSGRIALNYRGLHESLLDADELPAGHGYFILDDQRVLTHMPEDIHHRRGMSCIDCHISFGLMGDGNLYHHKEEQVKIACDDCHFYGSAETVPLAGLDHEASKIAFLRGYDRQEYPFLRSRKSGLAMVNTFVKGPGAFLNGKNNSEVYPLAPPADVCGKTEAHSSLDCNSCHTSWIPQCIGCHNEYDPDATGFDLLDYREKSGEWVEFTGLHLAEAPVLGILNDSMGDRLVSTFTPGMILTIDMSSHSGDPDDPDVFRRLYAPVSGHTTDSLSRTCSSCHLNPLAIGYGRGELVYDTLSGTGVFNFLPRFARRSEDGLPEDAWIPFLGELTGQTATRPGARPFNLEEQQRILLAGSCLICHPEDSEVMERSLWGFDGVLEKRSESCILPAWYINE